MKTTIVRNALFITLGSVSNVLAASGTREDNSGLFVWIFLGFCAVIIVAQLMPAALLLFGFAKALGTETPAETHRITNS